MTLNLRSNILLIMMCSFTSLCACLCKLSPYLQRSGLNANKVSSESEMTVFKVIMGAAES